MVATHPVIETDSSIHTLNAHEYMYASPPAPPCMCTYASSSLFWGVSVVAGIGWDIIPTTEVEIGYSSVVIVLGTVIYIIILSSVTSIVANFNSTNAKKSEQVTTAPVSMYSTVHCGYIIHCEKSMYTTIHCSSSMHHHPLSCGWC